MKVALFLKDGKSTLCIVENHMCMDGGDFKYFLKAFCKNYNDYVEKGISPIDLREGTRSYEAVFHDFSPTEQRMARNLYKNGCAKDDHKFPLTPDSIRDRSFIARRKIDEDKFAKIKAAGKKHGATINDMLVAAYFYSLYELAGYPKATASQFPARLICAAISKTSATKGLPTTPRLCSAISPNAGRIFSKRFNMSCTASISLSTTNSWDFTACRF